MSVLTKESVDWYFSRTDIKGFRNPDRAKKMCDMRLNGATYQEIGDTFGIDAPYARESVLRVARSWDIYKNHARKSKTKLTESEKYRIIKMYKTNSVEEIARKLGRSVGMVEKEISQMQAQGILPERRLSLNPNPITYTTKMLICRYHKDNLRKGMTDKAAIHNIASELSREVATIEEILGECKADGRYERYNL